MNYFLIITIPTFLYFLEENIKTNYKIFRKLGIAFIILMSSLRYNFGVDYTTYLDAFNRIKSGIYIDQFELGYMWLNKIVAGIGLNFNFLLFIIALFNCVLLYLTIEENVQKHKWVAMFIYLTYFDMFFYSLSAIRQSIAISIFLYASKYIRNKELGKYLGWICLASLFHKSAIILIFFYFIYNYVCNLSIRKLNIVTTVPIIAYMVLENFIILLKPYVGKKLQYYLFIEEFNGISSNITVAIVLFIVMIIWNMISIKEKSTDDKNNESSKIDVSMVAITIFLMLKIMQNIQYYSILPRIQMYFYFFAIVAIPKLIQTFKNKLKPIILIPLIIIMITSFVSKYQSISEYAGPYYEKFKTILNK